MTRPYSLDLRQRAVSLVEAGQSRRVVARLLDFREAIVIHWMQRHTTTGGCAANPVGGVRHAVLLHERHWLLAQIAAVPDLTVRALRAELALHGTRVSNDAVWRFLSVKRLSLKKLAGRRARTGVTWPASVRARGVIKARSIRPVLCSLTRPGPRQT